MDGLGAIVVALVGIPATYFLLKWKFSMGRRAIEQRLQADGINAEIVKMGIPPVKLWLRNRKGDSWEKVRFADGSEKWARLRGRLFGDSSFEFYG